MNQTISHLLHFYTFRGTPTSLDFDDFKDTVTTPKHLKETAKKHGALVWFYAHWCPHCTVIIPEWEKLQRNVSQYNSKIVAIDCAKHPEIRDYMGNKVPGFPTFLYIDKDFHTTDFADEGLPRTCKNFEAFLHKHEQ